MSPGERDLVPAARRTPDPVTGDGTVTGADPVTGAGTGDTATAPAGSGRWQRPLQVLPDLVATSAAAGLVSCGVLVAAGWFGVGQVVVLAAVLSLVLGRVVVGLVPDRDRWDALCSAVVLLGAAVWAGVNLPYVSQHVFLSRDPSVFVLSATWLSANPTAAVDPGAGVWDGPGFDPSPDGLMRSQNTHVVPAVAAAVGRVAGEQALLSANLLVGAAVLVAAYAAARRWMPPGFALVVPAALGLGLPFLVVARGLYTEPAGMLFLLGGIAVLLAAARRPTAPGLAVAGLLAGGASMVRIDGLLVVAALLPCVALVVHQRAGSPRRAATLLLTYVGAAAVPLLIGVVDLLLWSSETYLAEFGGTLLAGLGLVLATTLGCLLALLLAGRADRWAPARRARSLLAHPRTRVVAFGGLGAVLLAAVAAPLWLQMRNIDDGSQYAVFVEGLQDRLRVPIDRTRSYDEWSSVSITWYHGWVVVAAGLAGAVAMLAGSRRRPDLLAAPALLLPLVLMYTVRIDITPDQVWASRRLVVVVVPVMLLAAAWALSRLWLRGGGPERLVAASLAAAMVVAPATTLPGVAGTAVDEGAAGMSRELCDLVGDSVVLVSGGSFALAPHVAIMCGSTVVSSPLAAEPAVLRVMDAYGPDVVVVTGSQPSVSWVGGAPPLPTYSADLPALERTLTSAPRTVVEERFDVFVGRALPDGTVQPLTRDGRDLEPAVG